MRAQDRQRQVFVGVRGTQHQQLPEVRNEDAEAKYPNSYSVKFKKINREIKILMALNGKENAIKLLDIVK